MQAAGNKVFLLIWRSVIKLGINAKFIIIIIIFNLSHHCNLGVMVNQSTQSNQSQFGSLVQCYFGLVCNEKATKLSSVCSVNFWFSSFGLNESDQINQ